MNFTPPENEHVAPENGPLEKEIHFGNHHVQVPVNHSQKIHPCHCDHPMAALDFMQHQLWISAISSGFKKGFYHPKMANVPEMVQFLLKLSPLTTLIF